MNKTLLDTKVMRKKYRTYYKCKINCRLFLMAGKEVARRGREKLTMTDCVKRGRKVVKDLKNKPSTGATRENNVVRKFVTT